MIKFVTYCHYQSAIYCESNTTSSLGHTWSWLATLNQIINSKNTSFFAHVMPVLASVWNHNHLQNVQSFLYLFHFFSVPYPIFVFEQIFFNNFNFELNQILISYQIVQHMTYQGTKFNFFPALVFQKAWREYKLNLWYTMFVWKILSLWLGNLAHNWGCLKLWNNQAQNCVGIHIYAAANYLKMKKRWREDFLW